MKNFRSWLFWFAGLAAVLALAAGVTQHSAKAQTMGACGDYGLISGFSGGNVSGPILLAPTASTTQPGLGWIGLPGTSITSTVGELDIVAFSGVSQIQMTGGFLLIASPNNSLSGPTTLDNTLTSSRATDLGWTIQSAANQACNTTCVSACVHGFDTATSNTPVACTDATADKCLCAGAS